MCAPLCSLLVVIGHSRTAGQNRPEAVGAGLHHAMRFSVRQHHVNQHTLIHARRGEYGSLHTNGVFSVALLFRLQTNRRLFANTDSIKGPADRIEP